MKTLLKICFFIVDLSALVILFSCLPQSSSNLVQTEDIEIEPLFSLENFSPEVINTAILYGHSLCQDKNEKFYFLETINHRIIKTDVQGKILGQIGQIGQAEGDLYYPFGFNLFGEYLFILNNTGKEIKIFSTEGRYINSFKIDDVFQAQSIVTNSRLIFVDFRYKNWKAYDNSHLITSLSIDGQIIKRFGALIESDNFSRYVEFNLVYLSLVDDFLFGAFKFLPIIFCYKTNGNKRFYRDLKECNVEEINIIMERVKKENFDLPGKKVKLNQYFRGKVFCDGLAVDQAKNLFYVINCYKSEGFLFDKSIILIFNENGKLIKKIIPKLDDENIIIHQIALSTKGYIFGIGRRDKNYFIFKF